MREKPKINELSYQRYAKFYGNIEFKDEHFDEKISKITSLIKGGYRDIKEIAELSGCQFEECVLKIKYLQNKKQFMNIHIDKRALRLIDCSAEELELIKKYTPYVYYNHFTIDEITTKIRRSMQQDFSELR